MGYTLSDGHKMQYTCTGAVTNGSLIVIGDTVGLALVSGTTGQQITVAIEGVVTATKKSAASTNWAQGGQVYYIVTGGVNKLTGLAAAGKQIGTGWTAATATGTSGTVKLLGHAVITETQT